MLLKQSVLRRISDGSITLQCRRWKRPTVKSGGTLLTAVGQLSIEDVSPVDPRTIAVEEARAAAFEQLDALVSELTARESGQVYRIRLSWAGPDPRIEARSRLPSPDVRRTHRPAAKRDGGPGTHLVPQGIRPT